MGDISANAATLITSASIRSNAMGDFQEEKQELVKAQKEDELENEKKIMEKYLENSDVIQFNVGGEIMFTSRASLLHVVDSKLSQILLNKSEEKVSVDKDGNVFLDFNPKIFRHLLEQLRLFESDEEAVFYPPLTPALAVPFNIMLDKLGLKSAPISEEDIFTFNVGDEIIATKRKTLNRVPNSKLSTLLTTQADKHLEKRVYTLQSGTAIVTHSRSKKERRFSRVSRFFALSFHFLSVKTAKTPSFEC
jgi:hypothetical protein